MSTALSRYFSVRAAALSTLVWCGTAPGFANPPTVVAGSATVTTQGSTTTVEQTSGRAILNWQDFSIAAGDLMRFVQPDATSAMLNRVIGAAPSSLNGTLEANGRVYLINPNGVLIGAGARIDAAGFLASTLDVTNADFMRGGDLLFSGDSTAAVQNLGAINALGGDIFLIARKVENAGTLTATHGTAALAAGSEVLLTTGGDERVFVRSGSAPGEIVSSGAITSATAELKAAGGNSYALAINHTGAVRATGTAVRDGQVWLVADGGAVKASGEISAASHDGARGGEVRVLGDNVTLASGARIDVSGRNAGGTALIGGDYQGANAAVLNAEKTIIESGASIRADATEAGDGGRVIVWADGATSFRGDISARGGAMGGDGGFAEVSGKDYLNYRGTVDLRAPAGRTGTLLLDPDDIIIAASNPDLNGDTVTGDNVVGNIAVLDYPGAVSVITAGEVGNILAGASLSLAATNSITVNSAITWNAGTTLTLDAGSSIAVNATINGGALGSTSLISGGTINLGASVVGSLFTLNHAGALTQTAGTVSVTQLNLQGAGNVATSGAPLVTDLGTVVLNKSGGNTFISDIGSTAVQGTTNANLAVTAANNLDLRTIATGNGEFTATAGGFIQLTSGHQHSGSALTYRADGNITGQTNVTLTSSGGAITLNSDRAGNAAGTITLSTGTTITSNGGAITMGGSTNPALSNAAGVGSGVLIGGTTINSGSGAITIRGLTNGTGGTSGVGLTSSTISSTSGGISITGTATGSGATRRGVSLNGTSITTQTGAIAIDGTVNTGAQDAFGVITLGGSTITSTGTGGAGIISIAGRVNNVAQTAGVNQMGVDLEGGVSVTSVAGDVTINGTGGWSSSAGNHGIYLDGTVATTGGSLTFIGRAGSGGDGTQQGINTTAAAVIGSSSGTGAVTLSADTMNFTTGTSIRGTGTLRLVPVTATTSIGVGTGAAGTLQFSSAELDAIANGFSQIVLGNSISGAITTGSYTFKDPVRLWNNNNVFLNGALATGSGNQAGAVEVLSTGSIIFGNSASLTTQGQAVTLHADSDSVDGGNIRIRNASITTNGGAITLGGNNDPASQPARGVVGGGHVSDMSGIYLNRATLNSGGGNIYLNGRGATGSVADAAGVMIENGSSINSGTGTISIVGTGVGSNAGHIGINIRALDAFGGASQGGSTLTSANTGSLAIFFIGTGSSSGTNSAGVVVQAGSSLNASAGGAWIIGTGSGTDAGNHGISLLTGAGVTGTNELLSFSGTGGTNAQGINMTGSSTIANGPGNVFLAADTMNLAGSSISGSGTFYVRTRSAGTSLGLGDGAAGSLHLGNSELATIANGFAMLDFGTDNGNGTVDLRTVAFKDPLTINVGSGSGHINVNGALSTGSATEAGAITLNAGGDIIVASTGSVTTQGQAILLNSDRDGSQEGGIRLNAGSSITSNGGDITLRGNTGSGGYAYGSAATAYRGIYVVNSTISSGAGALTLRGAGGTIPGSDVAIGVDVVGPSAVVESTTGAVTLNGVGGIGNTALGISIFDNSQVRTTAGGNISITGSASAAGTFAAGVNIEMGASVLTQNGGNLAVTGTGSSNGAGALNHGVVIQNSALVLNNGSGALAIQGTAGAGGSGIATLTGTNYIGNTVAANHTGSLTLTADTLSLADVLIRGAGTLLIQPLTASTTMGVGDGATGTFNLTNAELGTIQDGFSSITVGRSNSSGAMTIGTAAFKDNVTLRSNAGAGAISVNGALSTGSSTAAGSITLLSAGNSGVDSGGSITTQGSAVTVTAGGAFNQSTGTTIATNGGDFTATMQPGGIISGSISTGAGDLEVTAAAADTTLSFIGASLATTTGDMTLRVGTSSSLGSKLHLNDGAALTTTDGSINLVATDSNGWIATGGTASTVSATGSGTITIDNANVTFWRNGSVMTAAGGDMTFNTGGFALGNLGTGTLNNSTGRVIISSTANNVDDDNGGTINAAQLRLLGSTDITLDNATHTIGTLAGSLTGSVTLNSDALTIGTVGATTGLNVGANTVTLQTRTGDLTLASGASIVSTATSGTSITLVTADQFINNAGASALDPGSGRFLVWSQTPVNDTRGGIPYNFKQYNATFGVTSPAQSSGNGFLYTLAPTITTSLFRSISRTYNGTDAATLAGTNYQTLGTIDGDVASLTLPTAGTFDNRNVGTGKTVTVTGLALDSVTNGGAPVYGYQLAATTISGPIGTITPATLTPGLTDAVTKVYDATTAATLDDDNYTLGGVFLSDVVTLNNPTSGTYDNANAGTGKTITVTGLAISGADAGNYVLSATTASGAIGTVTPKDVVVTALGGTSIYGDSPSNPGFTATGLVGGQDASVLTGLANNFAITNTSNADSYTLAVTGTLTNGNYNITTRNDGTWVVSPKDIVVTANGGSSIYGAGGTNPGFTATGLVNGQDESVLTGLGNNFAITTTSNAGSYTLAVTGTLTNGNYNVTTRNDGTWTVSPKDIIVTATGGTSVYGDSPTNPGFTATGLVNGQDESVLTGLGNNFAITNATNAGSYTLAVTGTLTNGNYNVTTRNDGTWTVSPKDITVTATGGTSTYGSSPSNPGFTATGLVNSQDASVLTGLGNNFSITNNTDAGSYTLAVTGTLTNGNYNITARNDGTWTVSPKDITVTATGGTSIYGASPSNPGFTATGLVNSQDTSVLTGLANNFSVTNNTNAGSYTLAVTGTLTNGNYNVTTRNDGTWIVSPKPITVTALGGSSSYGSSPANPGFTATGLVNGQGVNVLTGLANDFAITPTTTAGSYTLSVIGALTNGNYTVTARNTALWDVLGGILTITANNSTRVYGAANPLFTATYSGFVGNDNASLVSGLAFTTSATSASGVGTYTITPAGAIVPNYQIVFVPGTLSITPAPLTITAQNASRVFGSANPAFGATFSGFVNNDTSAVVSGLTFSTPANSASLVGNYAITPANASAANYTISYVPGTLQVTPPVVVVQDSPLTVPTINNVPVTTADYAVVIVGDRMILVPIANGRDRAPAVNDTLADTLGAVATLPRLQEGTLLLGAALNALAAGGGEVVAVLGGKTGSGSGGGLALEQMPNEQGLYRESTVSAGRFEVVYREVIDHVRELAATHTALGSSYHDFADTDSPQIILVRSTNNLAGDQTPASRTDRRE